ncbi:MMPL family transporter [Streptomyces sp. DSM 118878]
MLSRYREERAPGCAIPAQTLRTMPATSGRAVAISAATVAAVMAVLLLFPVPLSRSIAHAVSR